MTVAIGAPLIGTESNMFGNGLVEVFRFDGEANQWVPHGTSITGNASGQRLGSAVSLSADFHVLVIGSPGASTDSVIKAGVVSIFEFDVQATDWYLIQQHEGRDSNASLGWRSAISASGDSLIIGVRGSSTSPEENGSLFSLSRAHVIQLDGVSAGGGESQATRVNALSNQPPIVGHPVINAATGSSRADLG